MVRQPCEITVTLYLSPRFLKKSLGPGEWPWGVVLGPWGVVKRTWGPGEWSIGQISFNFNYKVNFKDFYTKLCVLFSQMKDTNISDGILILLPGSCPRVGLFGPGDAEGVKKNSNMVMWHIKSSEMTSRTESKLSF